jgi:hypothetical protein
MSRLLTVLALLAMLAVAASAVSIGGRYEFDLTQNSVEGKPPGTDSTVSGSIESLTETDSSDTVVHTLSLGSWSAETPANGYSNFTTTIQWEDGEDHGNMLWWFKYYPDEATITFGDSTVTVPAGSVKSGFEITEYTTQRSEDHKINLAVRIAWDISTKDVVKFVADGDFTAKADPIKEGDVEVGYRIKLGEKVAEYYFARSMIVEGENANVEVSRGEHDFDQQGYQDILASWPAGNTTYVDPVYNLSGVASLGPVFGLMLAMVVAVAAFVF